jgi:hypothetical protein
MRAAKNPLQANTDNEEHKRNKLMIISEVTTIT